MKVSWEKKLTPLNDRAYSEIDIRIYEKNEVYYGSNQYWYPKYFHRLSGCGPVAAAILTAVLAKNEPDRYGNLYPYPLEPYSKQDFIKHMIQLRQFVKPGIFGLTSVDQFCNQVLAYAQSREVWLTPVIGQTFINASDAAGFIKKALEQRLPVAMLILTHSDKFFDDYTWHWMTITDLIDCDTASVSAPVDTIETGIVVSTWGERHILDFNRLWDKRRNRDVIRFAYFM